MDNKLLSDDLLDDIVGNLDPKDIIMDFILMAKVTDMHGRESILRGDELAAFVNSPFSVAEVRVLLDLQEIRSTICDAISYIGERSGIIST